MACLRKFLAASVAGLLLPSPAFDDGGPTGDDSWGGRTSHPAVVNRVCDNDPAWTLSLSGDWEFTTRVKYDPRRNMFWGGWLQNREDWTIGDEGRKTETVRLIRVPGCWEAQRVGTNGMSIGYSMSDRSERMLRHFFSGEGWYRKSVAIPKTWHGRRVWLKIGGVSQIGWFWVNGRQVALVHVQGGARKYDITDCITPGSNAVIVAQVDNTCPSHQGGAICVNKWGGLTRTLELEATPQAFIDDVWLRGDFDARAAEARVEMAGGQAEDVRLRFRLEGRSVEATPKEGRNVLRLPIDGFRPWSPERPNLYTGVVELVRGGRVIQSVRERFGVRKIEVRGEDFYLNGKPFFLRGFGDDAVYPDTGASPADRVSHRRRLATARRAGFNYVRTHTHCEVDEYFDAADEVGILIQPELPYATDMPENKQHFDPVADARDLHYACRRHPSFATYCWGNEGRFGGTLGARLYKMAKAADPDRLVIQQDVPDDGRFNAPGDSDFVGGPQRPWERGSYRRDMPFVAHEYLNLSVKADSRSEGDYTGVWLAPLTRRARGAWLARFGLSHAWGDRLQDGQHALQRHYQKAGIEMARGDPYCDGYVFWTIVDVAVDQEGVCSCQGLFDPFWRTKRGGASPETFARFNSERCLLLDLDDRHRVYASGEKIPFAFGLVNGASEPLPAGELAWRVETEDGRTLGGGAIPVSATDTGPVRWLDDPQTFVVPELSAAVPATVHATLGPVRNEWPVWLFPRRTRRTEVVIASDDVSLKDVSRLYGTVRRFADRRAGDIIVARADSAEAQTAIAEGRPLITLSAVGKDNVKLGWWWFGKQVGMALEDCAELSRLPHGGVLSPLLFNVVKDNPAELPMAGMTEKDLLIVGEDKTSCKLYLGRLTHPSGTREYVCRGLDLLSGRPEATALLDGLLDALARKSGIVHVESGR